MTVKPVPVIFWALLIIFQVGIFPVYAGNTTVAPKEVHVLEKIIVTSTPFKRPDVEVPFAVSSVTADQIQLDRQQLSLQESLSNIPGLFFQDQFNFAQHLRVSIRGFGARANFGIRGVKIITDGIPSTLPDGQGNVDAIDLGSTQRIEVIRGPSSSLYGSAAGGVINIYTEEAPAAPFTEGRMMAGSYDFQQHHLKGGSQYDRLNALASMSHLFYGGYRDHSKAENTLLNTKFRYAPDSTSTLTALINVVDSPQAEDPGALTEAEVKEDRQKANASTLSFKAGEQVSQQKIGLVYRKSFDKKHQIALRNYAVWREFDNFQPFRKNSNNQGGSIDLNRFCWGSGADYTYTDQVFGHPNSLRAGLEIDAQRDERKRFINEFGVRGELTTNQDEDVTGCGLFLQDELSLMETLELTLGLRYDSLDYDVSDKIGTGSGSRTFDQPSPMAALIWKIMPEVNLYTNVSTSFEPPTTTELANPFGPTGFNPSPKPQKATNYEIGVKGLLPARLRYEAAVFHIAIEGELVPFELSGSGQTFYDSAGKSKRDGVETSLSLQPANGLTVIFTYTYSDFKFDRFADANGDRFDGNRIPGVPDNLFHVEVTYFHATGFSVSWDLLHADHFFANSANTVKTDPYTSSNFRVGYSGEFHRWEISPCLGINNLFDEQYNDNVRLNASAGRFFEPAPEINFYGGIRVSYNFQS